MHQVCRLICAAGFWTRPRAIPWPWSSCRAANAGRRPPRSQWLPLTDRLERAFFSRVSGLPAATRALLLVMAENDSRSLREVLDAGEVLLGEKVGLDALAPAVSAMLIEI